MQERSINAAQIEKIKSVFEQACVLGEPERHTYLREVSAGDSALEAELHSLLTAHDASGDFFEKLSQDLIGPALSALELSERDAVTDADGKILHYEILERIGVGGMGVVYKARDTRLARIVALKFLPRRDESNPAAQARLLAEARAASALDHPNIGVVYDIAEAPNGRQFMAMAWYDGQTLREKSRRGPMPVDETIAVGIQLASALAAAHGAGIIHRDVKPANVIITQSGTAKLLDFGIAKLMGAHEREMLLTAGTVAYMSPEQTRHEPLDARSDIWSVGVLLYEILAVQRPFQGETDEEIIAAIRTDEPAPLHVLRPDVPRALADVIHCCLKKEARDRYSSASELLAALRESEKNLVSSSPRNAAAGPLPRFFSGLTLSMTAGALLVAGLILWSYSRYREINGRPASPAQARPVSIAVMSFNGLQPLDSQSYLGRVLAEELRNKLSRYRNIAVSGYLSSSSYTDLETALPRLKGELGAQYAIAGKIEKSPANQLHLEIVDATTRRELWSGRYPLASAQLAILVPNATKQILSTLNITTSAAEAARTTMAETSNPIAYQLYLRGRDVELAAMPKNVLDQPPQESVRRAQAFYAQARALDPSFALNRAKLGMSHMKSAAVYDNTRARLEQARLEAETALRLDSGLVDAHETLAEYLSQTGNTPAAIVDLEHALQKVPHNVNLIVALGFTYRLGGRSEDAIEQFHLAQKLDPRNPFPFWYAAWTYGSMRRQDLGSLEFSRLIAISPEDYEMRIIKGQSYLRWKGTADTLLAQTAAIPPTWDQRGMATFGRYTALMVQRRYRDGLQMLDRSRSDLSTDGFVYSPNALMRGDMLRGLGQRNPARAEYSKAVAQLRDSLAAHPNQPEIHAALGLAYADLGNRQRAIKESEKAMSLAPLATTGPLATAVMGIAVQAFGLVGEGDRAFQMIELMLSMPSGREISVPFLKVWPGFDPLRNDPRFNQMLERFTIK